MTEFIPSEGRVGNSLFMTIREHQVILTASICLVALAIVLKNVLLVPTDILVRDMEIYTIVYLGFLVFSFRPDGNYERPEKTSPLAWDLLVVFITLAVIAVYAW